jgi:hypothetical protein
MVIPGNNNYDLGSLDIVGSSKEEVDNRLVSSDIVLTRRCIVCGNTPKYKLIPKVESVNTAEVQDRGYVCGHCVGLGNINPAHYGLRQL